MDETESDDDEISEPKSSMGPCGFMEIVIHHLLFTKYIYPRETFKKSQLNGIPFWVCVRPAVRKYVSGFLEYANECLMKLKELEIVFTVLRINKEVLEQFCFELKLHDSSDESDSKLSSEWDNLLSILQDIQKTNTFTADNTTHSGRMAITYELEFCTGIDDELPEDNSDMRWLRCPVDTISVHTSEGDTSKKLIPFMSQRNKQYEIKVYALK